MDTLLTKTMLSPTDVAITNTAAVLPDRVVDGATIVVRDGVIVEVTDRSVRTTGAVDARGAITIPGIVDTHSDGLEKELRPRPGVVLPMAFALRSFEGRVRGAGVTTMYHGVGFSNSDKYERTVGQANEMCDAIEGRAVSGHALIDHRILHRLDVRDADGLQALIDRVDRTTAAVSEADGGEPSLVSYEDHTPGRGQYTDRRWYERYVAGTKGLTDEQAQAYVDAIAEERDALLVNREAALPWLSERATSGTIRLMVHDPTELDELDEAVSMGATIAEFPTNILAAEAARERSLRSVCGAPNALRGESHSGNVSARELVALGLCDGLASDYLPSTMLGAAGALFGSGVCDLPTAVGLITWGPADTVGLDDRGRLEVGRRGDLVLFDLHGSLPTVRLVISQAGGDISTSTLEPLGSLVGRKA